MQINSRCLNELRRESGRLIDWLAYARDCSCGKQPGDLIRYDARIQPVKGGEFVRCHELPALCGEFVITRYVYLDSDVFEEVFSCLRYPTFLTS